MMASRAAVVLAVVLAGAIASGGEIVVDGIAFEGSPAAVAAFRDARTAFEVARRDYESAMKGYAAKTVSIGELTAAKERFVAAREKMNDLETDLDLKPSALPAAGHVMTPEEKAQVWAESDKVRDRLEVLRKMTPDPAVYGKRLADMLPKFKDHPAEGHILFALGNAIEKAPKEAEAYYLAVTRCLRGTDPWNYEQQAAWQKLAAIYEKEGRYEEAIHALENWKVSEQCGTGTAVSKMRRQFEIWRLSLHVQKLQDVRAEMWSALTRREFGWGFTSEEWIAKRILSLYTGDDGVLRRDLARARGKVNALPVDDALDRMTKAQFLKCLDAVEVALKSPPPAAEKPATTR